MSLRGQSPRTGKGNDSMESLLRDLDLRISALERSYIGTISNDGLGVTAVADNTQLPLDPNPGDRALDIGTGTTYTADAGGVWQLGGTPIP
jgi:hypothetical protein